jgi:hypothetical protein
LLCLCFSFESFGNVPVWRSPGLKAAPAYKNSQTIEATAIQNAADAKTTTRMAVSIPYTVVFISEALSE